MVWVPKAAEQQQQTRKKAVHGSKVGEEGRGRGGEKRRGKEDKAAVMVVVVGNYRG